MIVRRLGWLFNRDVDSAEGTTHWERAEVDEREATDLTYSERDEVDEEDDTDELDDPELDDDADDSNLDDVSEAEVDEFIKEFGIDLD